MESIVKKSSLVEKFSNFFSIRTFVKDNTTPTYLAITPPNLRQETALVIA